MATLSSHILDSTRGDHARGIRVSCYRIIRENETTETRTEVFSVVADEQGRITQELALHSDLDSRFELVFHSAEYFASVDDSSSHHAPMQIMPEVVVRLVIPEPDTRYHLPLVLSPHSCTFWWSGV